MGTIANLAVKIGVNTQDIAKGLDDVATQVGGIGGRLTAVGTAIAGAFSINAITGAAHEAVETASRIADMAERVGISAEAVQRLQFAAEQSGGSFEAIATSIRVMSDRLVDGKLPKALTDMGLSLGQLRAMSPDQAFVAIADAVAKIKDPMLQSATAVDIFGRGAQQILPAIKAGFTEVGNAAPVMSNQIVQSLDQSGDAWARMQTHMDNLRAQALAPLVSTFTGLPESVQVAAVGISQLTPSLEGIGIAILAAGGPVAAFEALSGAMAVVAAPTAVLAGIGAIAYKLQDLARQAIASGGAMGNFVSRSLGAGDLRPGLVGPKRTADIALPNDSIAGDGIGKLLEQGAKLPAVLGAAAKSTRSTTESTIALDKATRDAAQSAREYQAMISWARNEQGLFQMKLDEQAMIAARPLSSKQPSLAGFMFGPQNIGGSQGVSKSVSDTDGLSAGISLGANVKMGLSASLADMPNVILRAFQGGGNVASSIFSDLGGTIGSSLSGSIGKALSSKLGSTLGMAIGGIMGPLGAMLGPLIMDLAAKLGKKIWNGLQSAFGKDEEARDVNPARDAFLAKFGGGGTGEGSGFAALAAKLTELTGQSGGGSMFSALTAADTMAEFTQAVQAITEALAPKTPAAAGGIGGGGGGEGQAAPVINNTFNVNIELAARYVTTEDEWIRNQVTAGCLEAINQNAQGAFTKFEDLVQQALPPVPVFTPGLVPAV